MPPTSKVADESKGTRSLHCKAQKAISLTTVDGRNLVWPHIPNRYESWQEYMCVYIYAYIDLLPLCRCIYIYIYSYIYMYMHLSVDGSIYIRIWGPTDLDRPGKT